LYLCPAWFFPPQRPFFSNDKAAIDETLGEIQATSLFDIPHQHSQDLFENTLLNPFLEPAMARLVWWIPVGHVMPGRSGAQDPQNAIQDRSVIDPRAAFAIRSASYFRK
jgi:hypothetical protein